MNKKEAKLNSRKGYRKFFLYLMSKSKPISRKDMIEAFIKKYPDDTQIDVESKAQKETNRYVYLLMKEKLVKSVENKKSKHHSRLYFIRKGAKQ